MSSPTALTVDVHLPLDRFELAVSFQTTRPVTGLFGASGAGKTSLLETIAGLRRGARGQVRLGDKTWLDSQTRRFVPPEHRRIGYVPQDGLLFPHLDVRQNLLAGAKRAQRDGRSSGHAFETAAELLELTPLLSRDVSTLSGGERQRVALGRALCSGPRLLLLDEPLASLDLPLRRKLLPFLRRVRSELTVPMLLVSHDPIEVQALCDEVIVLHQGEQIERGDPRTVLRDPRIFPLAAEQSYENVLPGRFIEHGESTRVVRIGTEDPAVKLIVPRGDDTPGEVLLGLPANEILIATEPPRGLSARNILAARILEIRSEGVLGLITADLGSGVPPLVVEVTEATPAELGLEVGRDVFLVFKATSCRLYGEAGAPARALYTSRSSSSNGAL